MATPTRNMECDDEEGMEVHDLIFADDDSIDNYFPVG
jgi:hypothetical protein